MNDVENVGLVSVIMPSYNTAKYIAESIESVLKQTYKYWELIIADDCSDDDTADVVKAYSADERIRYIKNDVNSGAAVTRNNALREAKGKWIAFLDSDDLWEPSKLEKQITFMLKNGYAFTYTKYEEIDEASNAMGRYISGPKKINKRGMYRYCWPGCLTVMYDASKVGLIQIADVKKNNDYAMWLKVSQKEDCHLLDEVLGKYRKRTGSISNHNYKILIGWHYKLFRIAEKKSCIVAAILTVQNIFWGIYKKIKYVKKI